MTKLKKGDKITVLLPGPVVMPVRVTGPATAVMQAKAGKVRVVARDVNEFGQHVVYEPVDPREEDTRWMHGWSEETSNALLASATMAEPAAKPHLPPGTLAGAFTHVASRVGVALGLNPLLAAGLGAIAGHYVTKKFKKPAR